MDNLDANVESLIGTFNDTVVTDTVVPTETVVPETVVPETVVPQMEIGIIFNN